MTTTNEEGKAMEVLKRRSYVSCVTTGVLGFALIGLAACSAGESTSTTGTPAPGGSAALQGPLAFIKVEGNTKLAVVAHSGAAGNRVLSRMSFSGANAVGDM